MSIISQRREEMRKLVEKASNIRNKQQNNVSDINVGNTKKKNKLTKKAKKTSVDKDNSTNEQVKLDDRVLNLFGAPLNEIHSENSVNLSSETIGMQSDKESNTAANSNEDIMNIINPSKYTNVQHFMDLLSEEQKGSISEKKKPVKSPKDARLLRISILGNPNVGKSTLLNQLVQTKVSAVSRKRQTTREKVLAVYNMDEAQFVFYDTPGVISPKYRQAVPSVQAVSDPLLREAMSTLEKTDAILLMIDATKPLEEIDHLVKTISFYHKMMQATEEKIEKEQAKKKTFKPVDEPEEPKMPKKFQCIAVLNKKDLLKEDVSISDLKYALLETKVFVDVIPISALKKEGIEHLKKVLYTMAYSHKWLYDTVLPEMTIKQRIAEIVREKLYERVNKEVPYQVELHVARAELTKPIPDGVIVDVDFRVKTIGQRRIVIGALPYIHKRSLADLKKLFKTDKVHLSFEVNIIPEHIKLQGLSEEEKEKRLKLLTQSHRKSYHANVSQIEKKRIEKPETKSTKKKSHRVADVWQSTTI